MATERKTATKNGRWSQALEREIEAIETMELLRASTPPPRPDSADDEDGASLLSRDLLSAMGRSLPPLSVAPPAPRSRRLPAAWLALVAAVVVLSFVCARALANMGETNRRPRVIVETTVLVPRTPVLDEAKPEAAGRPAELLAVAPTATSQPAEAARRPVQRAGRPALAEDASAVRVSAIPDNPYEGGSLPAATATITPADAAANPVDGTERLIASALARPERRVAAERVATNELPDVGARALPATPSREAVGRAFDTVGAMARRCGGEAGSRVVVEIRVAGATGRVQAARAVDPRWSGTATGACVARVARLAKLPLFASSELVVRYPFEI